MPIIESRNKKVEIDDEGYLKNFDDWDREIACRLAEAEGVEELTKERLGILEFIRQYYKQYNFFPILNSVCKYVHQPKECIAEQFIDPVLAWKIAGLPKPDDMIINILHGQTPD